MLSNKEIEILFSNNNTKKYTILHHGDFIQDGTDYSFKEIMIKDNATNQKYNISILYYKLNEVDGYLDFKSLKIKKI